MRNGDIKRGKRDLAAGKRMGDGSGKSMCMEAVVAQWGVRRTTCNVGVRGLQTDSHANEFAQVHKVGPSPRRWSKPSGGLTLAVP
jgi:hypothetical protein